MTDRTHDTSNASDDNDVRRLLELAGPRAAPPADVRERVHAAVLESWRELPDEPRVNRISRDRTWYALAASVLVVALGGYFAVTRAPADPVVVGEIVYASGGYSVRGSDDTPSPYLLAGAMVNTSAEGRLLIRLDADTTVRLDTQTSATLHSGAEIWLHDGRLFVDSKGNDKGNGKADRGVEIVAPGGAHVTDVGTQFEVAVDGALLLVAVRQGQVNVRLSTKSVSAAARDGIGEIVNIDGLNEVSREPVASTDARWDWIHLSHPDFDVGSATVLEFVDWASRENGLTLVFEADAVRQLASTMGLGATSPIRASEIDRHRIGEVLETTLSFRILPARDHELMIGFTR